MLMTSISCAVSKPKRKASSLRASLARSTTCSARFKVQFCCLIPNSGMTSKRRFVSTWTVSSMVDRASAAPIAFATAAFSGIVIGKSIYSPMLAPRLGAVPPTTTICSGTNISGFTISATT